VLAGVGKNFAAISGDGELTDFEDVGEGGELENLVEAGGEEGFVLTAEFADGIVVRVGVGAEVAHGDVFIGERFDGEAKLGLLIELALGGRASVSSRDAFKAFMEELATQVVPGKVESSKLWLRVSQQRASAGNLEGAKAARKIINSAHFKDYQMEALNRQIDRLEDKER